tara:strand:- start:2251 stop:2772 length:522 start_codon:yes stop_codon:yes gene_type:complete
MTDYYKLYDYCILNTRISFNKKQNSLLNKRAKLKQELFNKLINVDICELKERAVLGHNSMVLYDDDYNELINELLESLSDHFKPFNVLYIKKNISSRGLFEVLKDESNYMLIIDWDVSKKTIEMKGNMIIEESHKADVKLSNINTILDTNIMSPNNDINVKSPNNDINGFICI